MSETEPQEPKNVANSSLEEVDSILAIQDPEFVRNLEELKEKGLRSDEEIKPVEINEAEVLVDVGNPDETSGEALVENLPLREKAKIFLRQLPAVLKTFLLRLFSRLKAGFVAAIKKVFSVGLWFKDLSTGNKLRIAGIVALLGLSIGAVDVFFRQGKLFQNFSKIELSSLADVSDKSLKFDDFSKWSSFNQSSKRPRYLFLFKKMNVRLKGPTGSETFGFFEIYIDPSSQRASVEVQRSEVEFRDLVARTIESFRADVLKTNQGKMKLKAALKERLNLRIESGYIREVYFKTLIIKE